MKTYYVVAKVYLYEMKGEREMQEIYWHTKAFDSCGKSVEESERDRKLVKSEQSQTHSHYLSI